MAGTLNRNLQLLAVSRAGTSDVLGPIGTFAWSMEGMTREFLAASGSGRTLELFAREFSGVSGVATLSFDRSLEVFTHALTAQAPPGAFSRQLRFLTHDMQGLTGAAGTLDRVTEELTRGFGGYSPAIGQAARTLRLFQRVMGGSTAVSDPIVLSMNTERQALTQYSNYAFNSFAKFNGVFLGASDAGVFELNGADDAGTGISAIARTGTTTFGTSHQKRVDRAYIGYRADGELRLRVITNETVAHDYAVNYRAISGIHGARVPIGKGLKSRYWQFELQNVGGADFEVDEIEIKPIVLRRRIGGQDA